MSLSLYLSYLKKSYIGGSVTTLVAILATVMIEVGDLNYLWAIIKSKVTPTKSSWIIFGLFGGLNMSSFLVTRFDVVSGLPIISDFLFYILILAAIFFYSSKEKIKFQEFEKYYLIGAFICAFFWIVSKDSYSTNILAQVLLTLGYVPTIHSMFQARESGESKFSWIFWTSGSLVALYPAIENRNDLAIVHCLRAAIMCLVVIIFIFAFSKKSPTMKEDVR